MPLSADDRLSIHELLSLHGHLADDRRAQDLHLLLTQDRRGRRGADAGGLADLAAHRRPGTDRLTVGS